MCCNETLLSMASLRQASALSCFRSRQIHMCSPKRFASHMAQATLSTALRSHLVHVLNREVPFILNITVLKQDRTLPWLLRHYSVSSMPLVLEGFAVWVLQLRWVLTAVFYSSNPSAFAWWRK